MMVSLDQAWSQIKRHLDWTRSYPSLLFVSAQAPSLISALAERLTIYAGHAHLDFENSNEQDPLRVAASLPALGIFVLNLSWQDASIRYRALAALNEIRGRLSTTGAGCLVITGPYSMRVEAMTTAADLWSVRSFAVTVGTEAPPAPLEEPPEISKVKQTRALAFAALEAPPTQRTPEVAEALRMIEAAGRRADSDLESARAIARQVGASSSPGTWTSAVANLATSELAALDGDVAEETMAYQHLLDDAKLLPAADRYELVIAAAGAAARNGRLTVASALAKQSLDDVRVLGDDIEDSVLAAALDRSAHVASAAGDWKTADQLYTESLTIRRELATHLDTPDTLRDLSVSLNNSGRIAEIRGDWNTADQLYTESLTIARDLAARLDTPDALRELSVSLNSSGRIAHALSDFDTADQLYTESLTIARELATHLDTPDALRDLSISLNNSGRIAEIRGDWNTADQLYTESLTIARDLATRLDTPDTLRDLGTCLNSSGGVAEARGDWDIADRLYTEFRTIARELATRLDTPDALRDYSISLDNAARVAEARSDLDTADQLYTESLTIARELATRLDTPDALREYSISLDNAARLAYTRGDWDTADQLYNESQAHFRDLTERLGTPGAVRDLVMSILHATSLAVARGDSDRATELLTEGEHLAGLASDAEPDNAANDVVASDIAKMRAAAVEV